jgi:hypothetical protein
MFGLRVFFNSPTQSHLKAGIEWCCSLWFLSLCLVLEYFSTVLPTPTQSRIEWCAAFVIPLCLILRVFFNSPTHSHLSRDWVMCCSLWFLSLCWVLEYFQQSYPFPPISREGWVMCCSLWFLSCVFSDKSIFQQSTQFLPIKQGLSDVLLFCDSFSLMF